MEAARPPIRERVRISARNGFTPSRFVFAIVIASLLFVALSISGANASESPSLQEQQGREVHPKLFSSLFIDSEHNPHNSLRVRDNPPANENITCHRTGKDSVECDGVTYSTEATDSAPSERFFIDLGVSIGLTLFAGLMSGLTMGLMSIDLMNLQILINGGSPSQKTYAKRILPLVKRHHLVLVTLLIWDAAAVEALPLFLDRLVGTIIAIVISVTCIVMFGEILPQAICTRFGLAIGGYMWWFVWILIILIFPIAWPISKLLDFMLGGSHGTFFRRAELKELVHLHKGQSGNIQNSGRGTDKGAGGDEGDGGGYDEEALIGEGFDGLSADEVTIIHGALDMKLKTVRDPMTPIDQVFMLEVTDTMGEHTMDRLLQEGYSRVPVYRKSRQNILGMILVKTLIKLNPADEVPIMDLELRRLPVVNADMPLFDMLNLFQRGHSHMAVVVEPEDHITVAGIITMEDVIEELIQEEIVDETDLTAVHQPTLGIASHNIAGFLTGSQPAPGDRPVGPLATPHAFVLKSSRANVPTRVAVRPDRIRSDRMLRSALIRSSAAHPLATATTTTTTTGGGYIGGGVSGLTETRKEQSHHRVPLHQARRGESYEEGGGGSFVPRSPSVAITGRKDSRTAEEGASYTDSVVRVGSLASPPAPNSSSRDYKTIPDADEGKKEKEPSTPPQQQSTNMHQSSHVIPTRAEKTPLLRGHTNQ